MEHMRLLLAIVLTFIVFLAWELVFVPQKPVQPPPQKEDTAARKQAPMPAEQPAPGGGMQGAPQKSVSVPAPGKSFRTITVETDLYKAEISEKGASVKHFVLKDYRTNPESGAPFKELIDGDNELGTAIVRLASPDYEDLSGAIFTTDLPQNHLKVTREPLALSFFWQSEEGLVLEKRYRFHPGSYGIDLTVNVINQSDSPQEAGVLLDMVNPPPEGSTFVFQGPFAYINKELKEIDIGDIAEKGTYEGNIQWAGIEDRYFMTTLIPKAPIHTEIRLDLDQQAKLLKVTYVQPSDPLPPATRHQFEYRLFLGPKRMSVLEGFGHDLDKAINFGWFDIIAKPCLWLMNAIHDKGISNYGVAIILLTILFKLIFWPLGNKSYRSMAEMKKLQPLMTDIRKKYKDDKQKMNEEVMRLYRTYKVNPMSGCLPMLVQIPVFIAFYRMLYEAIELRHASFMLWIDDLSAPDRLFEFGFTVPFMAPPYGIPVLTIIMGGTMFLQQKLSPPPGDPSQAKLMMMMPLIFTVIFINFPSGLVLYWLTNNLLSIAQQYYITRKTV